MPSYRYLIVGAGMTADAAVRGIRGVDPEGTIGLIGEEPHPPYSRPPLSKGLWQGKPLESIWRKTPPDHVTLHLGTRAVSLNPAARQVVDDQGRIYDYMKLLLATGGTPRKLPFASEQIIYFRTLEDYQHLRALADQGQRFAVIGGGFIGTEIAAALTMIGKEVVMVFPGEGIGERVFPAEMAQFLNGFYRAKGVEVLAGRLVDGLEQKGERLVVLTREAKGPEKQSFVVDGVVAGLGIGPNVELAGAAGLAVGNGVVVDEFLRTSHPDIYAAGDVAEFHSSLLGMRQRVEHEDNANTMGVVAGQGMAGERAVYDHQPFFYSDLFELGYEAVGHLDPRLEIVAVWQEPHRKGIVYYLRDGRVRGVLLLDVWGQVQAARRLIAEPGPFRASDLEQRLPA